MSDHSDITTLTDLLVLLSGDSGLLAEYESDPAAFLATTGLNDHGKKLLLAGNLGAVQEAVDAEQPGGDDRSGGGEAGPPEQSGCHVEGIFWGHAGGSGG